MTHPASTAHTLPVPRVHSGPPFTLAELLATTGGVPVAGGRADVSSVSTDTRTLEAGALFVALRGERFDAHDFLPEAFAAGAAGALVDVAWWGSGNSARVFGSAGESAGPVIAVPDTLRALGALAAAHRRRVGTPLVGVGGSNGKTTTKEMIAAILAAHVGDAAVLRTQGNLNNLIGCPLTLLRLTAEHRFGVIEMGMNVPGELAAMAAMTAPEVALVTNVQPEHLEGLGSLEGVARAEGELYDALAPTAVAVVNADDAMARDVAAARTAARRVYFSGEGGAGPADAVRVVSAETRAFPEPPCTLVRLAIPAALAGADAAPDAAGAGALVDVRLPRLGAHNALNAAGAAAAALALGAPLKAVVAGLQSVPPVAGRLVWSRLQSTRPDVAACHVLDDTYNANPGSMDAALRVLGELVLSAAASGVVGRAFACLGDMLELGPDAPALHAALGAAAAAAGLSGLALVGPLSTTAGRDAAIAAGLDPSCVFAAPTHAAAADWLAARLRPADWLLVKGSRGSRTERVLQALAAPVRPEGAR